MSRKGYLDWLRGVAVLIMVDAHLFDAWVRLSDRSDRQYRLAISVGGFAAPLFLFLAGVALMLATGSHLRRGATVDEVASLARRRGWQIFALAYLFRLQSYLISGGTFPDTLLKVDILNIMGLSMLLAALIWWLVASRSAGVHRFVHAAVFGLVALAFAMVTPLVRAGTTPEWLPYPVEWHLRAVPGTGAFTLFPWVGFLLAGCAVGLWLDQARSEVAERRVMIGLFSTGAAVALGGYGASFLPPLFPMTTFWTGSPTFFLVRLGVLMAAIPVAYVWSARSRRWSPVRQMGVASLFVYWIHVEMVYGVVSLPLHRKLEFWQAMGAYVSFCLFLLGLVMLKDRFRGRRSIAAPLHVAPSRS